MTNPNLPDNPPVQVAESAFRMVWGLSGWVESDPPPDDKPKPPKAKATKTAKPTAPGGLSHAGDDPAPTSKEN